MIDDILIFTRSRHKNMYSLKFVDERQLFKATTKLVDCGTQLYSLKSESWVKRSHQKDTESIHGNEWMEMNWTLYVWRHPTILSVFKWNACFLNACFPCECQNLQTMQEERHIFLFFGRSNKIGYHTNREGFVYLDSHLCFIG